MTREEKIKVAIKKGFTCNPDTGDIFGIKGGLVKSITNGYIVFGFIHDKKLYNLLGHQFVYYYVHEKIVECIDHINRNRADNSISNLRSTTKQENNFNRDSKGYTYHKVAKKWLAQIRVYGKQKYLGLFNTEEEASQAYLEAKKIYHII
jgi:hypothetical protein